MNQEMEAERLAQEKKEEEKKKNLQKFKDEFSNPKSEWQKDKQEMQEMQESAEQEVDSGRNGIADDVKADKITDKAAAAADIPPQPKAADEDNKAAG